MRSRWGRAGEETKTVAQVPWRPCSDATSSYPLAAGWCQACLAFKWPTRIA